MALRLSDYVLYGELYNTTRFSTRGIVILRGREDFPLSIQLTGDCSPDLKGLAFRFEPGRLEPDAAAAPPLPKGLPMQVGPTGEMSAAGWVRTFDCTTEEFLRRHKLGEPPPTTWRRRLYLEWFSQNGNVVIELADPNIEYKVGEDEWAPLPHRATPPLDYDEPENRPAGGPSITMIENPGRKLTFHLIPPELLEPQPDPEPYTPPFKTSDAAASDPEDEDEIFPYPSSEESSSESEDDDDPFMQEMELMDDLIENDPGERMVSAFDGPPRRLPRPDDLDDEQVESQVKVLLAELARRGVALHICEHFTWRDTYRLMLERLFQEDDFFPQLKGTGWTQNFMTSEYCPQCMAEDDEEYEDFKPE